MARVYKKGDTSLTIYPTAQYAYERLPQACSVARAPIVAILALYSIQKREISTNA